MKSQERERIGDAMAELATRSYCEGYRDGVKAAVQKYMQWAEADRDQVLDRANTLIRMKDEAAAQIPQDGVVAEALAEAQAGRRQQ